MEAIPARIEAYLAHLAGERRLSPNTIENYRRDLLAFDGWLRQRGQRDLGAVDAEQLRGFIADEHRRGLSATSLQRRLSALTLIALSAKRCLRCDIGGGDLWKFWRPLRPVEHHA